MGSPACQRYTSGWIETCINRSRLAEERSIWLSVEVEEGNLQRRRDPSFYVVTSSSLPMAAVDAGTSPNVTPADVGMVGPVRWRQSGRKVPNHMAPSIGNRAKMDFIGRPLLSLDLPCLPVPQQTGRYVGNCPRSWLVPAPSLVSSSFSLLRTGRLMIERASDEHPVHLGETVSDRDRSRGT